MESNEFKYVEEVFKSNYIAPVGEFLTKFENKISDFTGIKHVAAVSSGTAAIHLALRVLGIGKGDIVLSSTFTFIGSVTPILFQNAFPFFIDSNFFSWNLDPNLLEDAIFQIKKSGNQAKALIVTHLYGQSAEIDKISEICKNNNILLIEDAAESLGAMFNNRHTGSFGEIGIYSFNGNKIITTSGGGAIASNNENFIKKAKFLSTQAKEDNIWYEHKEIGYNYRLSNVLAAIGTGQMEVLDKKIQRKREIFNIYKELLSDINEINFMPEIENSFGNRWLTTLTLDKTNPLKIIEKLEEYNIESRPLWKPMHLQPALKKYDSLVNGTSEKLFQKGICLPSGTAMTDKEVEQVCNIIKKAI